MKVSSLLFFLGPKFYLASRQVHIFERKLQDLEFESIHFVDI